MKSVPLAGYNVRACKDECRVSGLRVRVKRGETEVAQMKDKQKVINGRNVFRALTPSGKVGARSGG